MSSDLRTAIIENITIADFLRSEGYDCLLYTSDAADD